MQTLQKHLLEDSTIDSHHADKFTSDTEFSRPRRRLRFNRHRKMSITASTVQAHSFCEKLDVNEIFLSLSSFFSDITYKGKLSREVAVVVLKNDQFLFFFEFGAVVFWAVSNERATKILSDIKRFGVKLHANEIETIGYEEGERFQISQDVIELGSKDIFEKLAVSYAMAQVMFT